MAEFLDTQAISHYLNKLIDNSEKKLCLICPYLKFGNLLQKKLELKSKGDIEFKVVYGKDSILRNDQADWFKSIPKIELLFLKEIHAKCYFSDKEAIITSMNLHDYSQTHNYEMGIYISKNNDPVLYGNIHKEVDRILCYAISPSTLENKVNQKSFEDHPKKDGFCILTGVNITFDINKPFCQEEFDLWVANGKLDQPGTYCHYTGENSLGANTSFKPILWKNYKEAQKEHDFKIL